ncbi:MAG: hypothetical protein Q8S20_15705 [Sulfuritalea sp.]|nr:hypothetical protein [Sulfuritalea sp.]
MADTATGTLARLVPHGPERDELLLLVRLGVKFQRQHVGKRPGYLHSYVVGIVANMAPPITFANLLAELDLAAARRAAGDGRGEPIERLSRTWQQLTFHDPKRGRQQITFGRLRNVFTTAKKATFPSCPKA